VKIEDKISEFKKAKPKTKKYSSLIQRGSLKEAIIIKEILDKPISLRKYFRFDSPIRI
jgi:hypothetical protein